VKVLLAGASGVLGRPALRLFVEAGHTVVGLARSDAAAETIRALGGYPAPGDVLDAAAVRAASEGADAVVNLTAALPVGTDPRATAKEHDRVRLVGTRNLLAAAEATGAQVYVQESVSYVYGDRGAAWVTEEDRPSGKLAPAALAAEAAVRAATVPSVILRFGWLYARDAWHTRLMVSRLRQRRFPIFGGGENHWAPLHADDAARAILAAVEDAPPNSIFNVCDDEPVTMAALFSHLATLVDAPPPMKVPALLARAIVGGDVVAALTSSIRMSNRAMTKDLKVTPRFPTYREGLADVVGPHPPTPSL